MNLPFTSFTLTPKAAGMGLSTAVGISRWASFARPVCILLLLSLTSLSSLAQTASVSALSPLRNAKSVEKDTDVKVTLNANWASGPEGSQAVTVWSGQAGGKKAGTATVSGNSLTFNPTTDFKPGETVFATTTTASGLAKAHVHQFTTAAAPAPGTFSGGSDVAAGGGGIYSIAAADVDGDGDLDILVTNRDVNNVSVRLNNGTGSYSNGANVAVGSFPIGIAAADVDGDGHLDILAANSGDGSVSVRLNNGNGTFSGGSQVTLGGQPYGIVAADVDGDGDLDILTANGINFGTSVSVRLNNGDGTFTGGSDVAVRVNPFSIAAADVDVDGDLDILAANNSGDGSVSVRLNNGNGTFTGGSEVAVGANPYSVAAADVDGDGHLDILAANKNSASVSVRLNNGDGTFTGGSEVAVGIQPYSVAAADVDGDGDLDMLVANRDVNSASVRLNNGDGTFTGGSEVAVGRFPRSVAAADVDGDGDLDILAANEVGSVSVRFNQAAQPIDMEKPVITINGNQTMGNDAGLCTALVTVSATATDNASVGAPTGVRSDGQALDAPYPVGTTTITWNVTDENGNAAVPVQQTVTVTNAAPLISSVTAPISPVAVNTAINLTVAFTDNNVTSAAIDWGDGTAVQHVANPGNGFGTPHPYTAAGVYTVKVSLTDACKVASAEYEYQYVVVYDPNGGFVTGGGWIISPAGAYAPDPSAAGKANFGFVSKYQKGATLPTGKTDFEFKAVGLEFASTAYEWLVVAGAKAQYKGAGTLNGVAGYKFILTAIDGQVSGGGGTDKFRIKIWKNGETTPVYDNQRGAADDAAATTEIGGGSIVVHDGKGKGARMDNTLQSELAAKATLYPNPVVDHVTIDLQGMPAAKAKTLLTDALGKPVGQQAHKVVGASLLEIDMSALQPGLYIIGTQTEAAYQLLKVIKQ